MLVEVADKVGAGQGAPPRLTPAILPLFRELGDLKRIRSAEREGSTAERLFRDGWAALGAGAPAPQVMARIVAAALAAAVRSLAHDAALAHRVAAGGLAAYREQASEAVLGARWRGLLERLLA